MNRKALEIFGKEILKRRGIVDQKALEIFAKEMLKRRGIVNKKSLGDLYQGDAEEARHSEQEKPWKSLPRRCKRGEA